MRRSVGGAFLLVGCALAVVGLGLYQAWWTVVFPIAGAIAYALDRPGARPGRTIAIGVGVSGALALGAIGLFVVAMSPFSCARPDVPCPEGAPSFLWLGAAALVGAILALALLTRYARRS